MSVVLDSSAVLAYVFNEPGVERVAEVLHGSQVSSVNLFEVIAKLAEHDIADHAILDIINQLSCTYEPFTEAQSITAGLLRKATKHLGLSMGDRACLSLALHQRLPVLTADRNWKGLDIRVEIEVIR